MFFSEGESQTSHRDDIGRDQSSQDGARRPVKRRRLPSGNRRSADIPMSPVLINRSSHASEYDSPTPAPGEGPPGLLADFDPGPDFIRVKYVDIFKRGSGPLGDL